MKRIFISFTAQPCSLNDLGVAYKQIRGFPGGSDSKNPPAKGDMGSIPGLGRSGEGNGNPYCLKNPWTEESSGLQSMRLQRVGPTAKTANNKGRTGAEFPILPTSCEEPTQWKRSWCWERAKEGMRRRWLDGIINSMDMSLSKLGDEGQGSLECCRSWGLRVRWDSDKSSASRAQDSWCFQAPTSMSFPGVRGSSWQIGHLALECKF